MARTPNVDPPAPPSPGSLRGRAEHAEPPEIFGAIALERYVKDDGRALILYSPAAPSEASGDHSA